MEDNVVKYIDKLSEKYIPIRSSLIKKHVLDISSIFGISNFKVSDGWFQRFKHRHGISLKNLYGEMLSADSDATHKLKIEETNIL